MDVLSWSRHHRLFPGEGSFDLTGFLRHVLATGYDGPLSLEVFNDTFRQTDPVRTARQALRSLRWLADGAGVGSPPLPPARQPVGYDFVEVRAADTEPVEVLLDQLGFGFGGRHRSKGVRLWTHGEARVVLDEHADCGAAERFAEILADPVVPRPHGGAAEARARGLGDGPDQHPAHAAGGADHRDSDLVRHRSPLPPLTRAALDRI